MSSGGHFENRYHDPASPPKFFLTFGVVPQTNFNRNLGDLEMHTGPPPPSAIGLYIKQQINTKLAPQQDC